MTANQIIDLMTNQIAGDIQTIKNACRFKGGCERWLQMHFALKFVHDGFGVNRNIFLEARYVNLNGAADMVVQIQEFNRSDFLVLELKIPTENAKIEEVINDLYKIWNQPTLQLSDDLNWLPTYGAFLIVINPEFFDSEDVLHQIIDTFHQHSGIAKGTIRNQIRLKSIPTNGRPFVMLYLLRHYQ